MMRNLAMNACALALALVANLGQGQTAPVVISDEYCPTNTDIRSLDVSGVKLGMAIEQVRAMNSNLVQSSQFAKRKDIDQPVEEYTILSASEILHGREHVWPGWTTVDIMFTRPELGSKACSMSFSKEVGALPDLTELESRLCKKYGPWCRKRVTKQDTGAVTVKFTWGLFDKQQNCFIGTGPTLDVWMTPGRWSNSEPIYKVTFNLDDPKFKRANSNAVDTAVSELKVKSVQAIPF